MAALLKDIQFAEFLIALCQHGAPRGLLNPVPGLLCVTNFLQIADQDVRTFPRERDCYRAANAGVGTGDDRRFASKSAAAFV